VPKQIEVCHTSAERTYTYQKDAFTTEVYTFACIEGASKVAGSASLLLALAIAYLMA